MVSSVHSCGWAASQPPCWGQRPSVRSRGSKRIRTVPEEAHQKTPRKTSADSSSLLLPGRARFRAGYRPDQWLRAVSLTSSGGLRLPVRNVLDSEGCQSYQCPSLGTWCIRVPPRWRERFGSKLRAVRVFKFSGVEGLAPGDLLDVRVFSRARSAKADHRAQLPESAGPSTDCVH
jgi:hypothetical protein